MVVRVHPGPLQLGTQNMTHFYPFLDPKLDPELVQKWVKSGSKTGEFDHPKCDIWGIRNRSIWGIRNRDPIEISRVPGVRGTPRSETQSGLLGLYSLAYARARRYI